MTTEKAVGYVSIVVNLSQLKTIVYPVRNAEKDVRLTIERTEKATEITLKPIMKTTKITLKPIMKITKIIIRIIIKTTISNAKQQVEQAD